MPYDHSQIVKVATADGLYLRGFFQPGLRDHNAVLHVHGFEGNFYENDFLDSIADELKKIAVTWLPVNTRGHGKETDFPTTNRTYRTIGARYELLEEAFLDIDAWVEFLIRQGYTRIVLMGHSLGTMKAVRYLTEGQHKRHIKKLILLAPFDKTGLLFADTNRPLANLLDAAAAQVAAGHGEDLIPAEFNTIKLSYQTYISWYQQDELGRCFEFCHPDYGLPALSQITIPTKIIVGAKDEFFHASNPDNPQEAMDLMLRVMPQSNGVIIPGVGHSFYPQEKILADEVREFVQD